MSNSSIVDEIVAAFAVPPSARVDQRVAKKYFLEHGAPSSTDKRYVQEGIEEVIWLSALKPSTVGLASYKDEMREYTEIQLLSVLMRPEAKKNRLTELMHRSIPYPIGLVSSVGEVVSLSFAHKRDSKAEKESVVLDGLLVEETFSKVLNDIEEVFLKTLAIAEQQTKDLYGLYSSWIDRIQALRAARRTGRFELKTTHGDVEKRIIALADYDRIQREIAELSSKAKNENQMNRRVELNMAIKKLELQLLDLLNKM